MTQRYIVGDVVMYNNEVQTIVDNYVSNTYELDSIYYPVNWNELSGVPITPEILEKNGWSKGQIYFRHSHIPRIKLCTADGGISWSVSINDDIMGSYINYVHQLQHILFAFGIEEEMEV